MIKVNIIHIEIKADVYAAFFCSTRPPSNHRASARDAYGVHEWTLGGRKITEHEVWSDMRADIEQEGKSPPARLQKFTIYEF